MPSSLSFGCEDRLTCEDTGNRVRSVQGGLLEMLLEVELLIKNPAGPDSSLWEGLSPA